MDKGPVEILNENIHAINLSLKRLLYSFENCCKIGLKDSFSEEEFESFEAMTSRYARTTDMLISKVLRGTIIDAVNNTEKRGIADAQDLRKLKDLRNSIAHEYVIENIVRFFDKVMEFTPLLKTVIENLTKYCTRYVEDIKEKIK